MATRRKQGPESIADLSKRLVSKIEEEHGEGSAMILGGDPKNIIPLEQGVLSTRCKALDRALGRGGIPFGRITLLTGHEGSGKSTLCLELCAECQRRGGIVIYQDTEYKLNLEYAARIGVDTKTLILSQPPHLAKCFDVMESCIERIRDLRKETGQAIPTLIIMDSITAAPSKAELEGAYGDAHVAEQARIMSLGLRKITPLISKERVILLLVSQLRQKVGVIFGNPDRTSGGKAPRFYASTGLKITKTEKFQRSGVDGIRVNCHVFKNQVAPPFKTAIFEIIFDQGINHIGSLIDVARELKVITKSGNWKIWQELDAEGKLVEEWRFQSPEGLLKYEKEQPGLLKKLEGVIDAK